MKFAFAWPPTWPPKDRLVTVVLPFSVMVVVGWFFRPALWPIGPLGALRRAWAQVAQESSWNPDAAGDDGGSVGLLQFSSDKADWYVEGWRSSPLLAGWAWGRYVREAPWPWLVRFWIPVYGWAWMRYAWTHGYANDPPSLADIESQVSTEASGAGYMAAFLVTAPISLVFSLVFLVVLLRRRKRR